MTPTLAFLLAFLVAFAMLPGLIRLLTRRRVEQVISEDVPEHQGKKGTPTLGGIAIVLATVVVSLGYAFTTPGAGDVMALALLFLITSLLGFWDDYLILSRGRNAGQKWSQKLAAQLAVAAAFVLYLWQNNGPALTQVIIPGTSHVLELGLWWFPLAVLYMGFMSNAANLSDGLDGLAGGLSLIAAFSCAAAALSTHQAGIAVFDMALGGACLGFLWYTCHPAQIFMGNTSSIGLGMVLAAAALLTRQEILLLLPFAVFLAEGFSVMIQVGYFKLTHRRIFKKAPLHHHFEMLGWKETKVVARFWIVAGILAAVARLWMPS
ncbi:MAG: phospho-N-acetylmuramoyl-pentapeptide-transferase [Armatimonadota bacterium]|nr:phospho-N-acetylmuramoyl-pentapeptide-transferase [Armatimonadota bacterium]